MLSSADIHPWPRRSYTSGLLTWIRPSVRIPFWSTSPEVDQNLAKYALLNVRDIRGFSRPWSAMIAWLPIRKSTECATGARVIGGKIQNDPRAVVNHCLQALEQLGPAVTEQRAEDIAGQAFLVNVRQHVTARGDLAVHQRDTFAGRSGGTVTNSPEIALVFTRGTPPQRGGCRPTSRG